MSKFVVVVVVYKYVCCQETDHTQLCPCQLWVLDQGLMDPVDPESPFLGARGDMKRVGSPRGDRGEVSSDRQFERLVDAASRSSCGVDGEENGWSARPSWNGRARCANLEPVGF
jgi:hypothetical protein